MNTFYENYGCPKYGGSTFAFECLVDGGANDDRLSIAKNDSVNVRSLFDPAFMNNQGKVKQNAYDLTSIDFSVPITANYKSITLSDGTGIPVDMNSFQLLSNIYTSNYASLCKGIVDITGQ